MSADALPSNEPPGRDSKYDRILAAAASVIAEQGLANVRMAGIARAAGVSSGLLHYHFDTKEQLFAEVLTYSSRLSDAITERALERASDQPAGTKKESSTPARVVPGGAAVARESIIRPS